MHSIISASTENSFNAPGEKLFFLIELTLRPTNAAVIRWLYYGVLKFKKYENLRKVIAVFGDIDIGQTFDEICCPILVLQPHGCCQ